MSMFKIGNSFELLQAEKELCKTFYISKIFQDKRFEYDFKALISIHLVIILL